MRAPALGPLCLLLAGCSLITGVDRQRRMGAIGFPSRLAITVPDTVPARRDFVLTVRTFGADGCWSGDGTDVAVHDLSATVTPWDVNENRRGTGCTQMVVEITHTATLRFEQPGVAAVEVRGRDGTATRSIVVE